MLHLFRPPRASRPRRGWARVLHVIATCLDAIATLVAAALALFLAAGLGSLAPAHAGPFVVQPTRLELGAGARSGALVVRNEASTPQSFQVTGLAWSQDAQGEEHYAETSELLYFPRLLTIPPGQDAVIRVGLRQPPGALEKTYRIFIQELAPGPAKAAGPGARIRVVMRFGAPVFVRPLREQRRLALQDLGYQEGLARWSVRNEGTVHEAFQAITLRGLDNAGDEVFRQDLTGRYLLAGDERQFEAAIPGDACPRLARLTLSIKTEQSVAEGDLAVGANPCR